MEHKISITFEKHALGNLTIRRHIRSCIEAALKAEGVNVPCEINVYVCSDETIRAINKASRQIDKATDVLSFPMFTLTAGRLPESWDEYIDVGTGLVPLGAQEFGHSAKREVGYLTIHSILHLLGYDHVDEGEMKRQMRAREEAILAEIELPR